MVLFYIGMLVSESLSKEVTFRWIPAHVTVFSIRSATSLPAHFSRLSLVLLTSLFASE